MYHVRAQGVDERMINVHYYYQYHGLVLGSASGWNILLVPLVNK